MSGHTCHATGCEAAVPPSMFMPPPLVARAQGHAAAIWAARRPGQEITKDQSLAYLAAAGAAIAYVARTEETA